VQAGGGGGGNGARCTRSPTTRRRQPPLAHDTINTDVRRSVRASIGGGRPPEVTHHHPTAGTRWDGRSRSARLRPSLRSACALIPARGPAAAASQRQGGAGESQQPRGPFGVGSSFRVVGTTAGPADAPGTTPRLAKRVRTRAAARSSGPRWRMWRGPGRRAARERTLLAVDRESTCGRGGETEASEEDERGRMPKRRSASACCVGPPGAWWLPHRMRTASS
jgi:hypothetical protein